MMNSGLILFNKPPGITSFDALRGIKRALGTGKVGHTGTLDKFASGLLIVLTGKALRLSKYFTHCDKKYTGKIHFGKETDTLDPEGKITAEASPPGREEIENALPQFTGEILQEPPVFSAIHVNGKRASSLVRTGQMPEMKKRKITIYELKLLSWNPPFAEIYIHCSSGTYIRSLVRDIALAAGSRGYLCELTRTQVAGFELGMTNDEKSGIFVRPINKNIITKLGLPWFEVSAQEAQNILHGKPLNKEHFSSSALHTPDYSLTDNPYPLLQSAAVFHDEELIAVIEQINGNWKYGCVIS